MKTIISALLLIGTLGAYSGVHAQNSTLRIACKGKDVGAEVSIDGQFKGECPLEARVSAGTVKLRLVKKVDSLRERVFEQDIRIGSGVVKQVDAVLSAPRSMAKGQGRGNTSPAAESAESGIRAQADTAATQESAPPRPPIPLAISEDIWKIIEASEAYRNLPQPRAIKAVFRSKQETEYTGSKIRSLPNPAAKTISTTRVIAPVGDKCTMMLTDSVTDGKPDGASGSYYCGSIWLGLISGGKPMSIISSIDELKGSLFPMRVGARQTKRFQMAFVADRKYDSTHASDCAVVSRLAAQELDPRLAGAAWKVHCKSSYNSGNETEADDYYLEDLAVMLSTLGAYDFSKKTSVLPSPGTQTLMETEGDYGSRYTTTYASYNWETGGTYEVPAQMAAVAAPSSDGRPAAVRDESAQREQPQPAELIGNAALAQDLKAAADGNASAMTRLGVRYETGKGVTKDLVQATAWYRKAAESGDIAGMAGYGDMLFNGTSTSYSSMNGARVWWSKAADAGNGRALNGMGRLYFNGWAGVPRDTEKAMVLFEKAVEAGEPLARNNIAQVLDYDPSARRFLKNGNILQARSNTGVGAASQASQAEERPASGGSGFFGAMLGGLASSVVDRTASQINSQAAGSGNAVLGALAGANTQLANASKEQIARDMGGNGSVEGMAGAMVGNALGSGSRAGAMAAFSGATNNLAGSALSGAASSSAGPVQAPSGSARIFVVSRKTKEAACEESKRMTKADGQQITGTCSCNTLFDSNNCRAQVVGESGPTVTASTKAVAEACERDYQGPGTDPQFDSYCKQAHFGQCLEKKTGVTTYRVEARTACNTLDQLLRATKGGRAAAYCTYCK